MHSDLLAGKIETGVSAVDPTMALATSPATESSLLSKFYHPVLVGGVAEDGDGWDTYSQMGAPRRWY